MADPSPELLKNTPTDVVTSQAPTGGLSAGQIEQPFNDAAATLGKFGEVANDFAVPAAQRQAAADLANQKVVRNPDGSVGVLNPASAMILGDGGRAYSRAVQEGTADQILASVRPDLAALHAANPLDGPGLGKANDAYLTKLQSSLAGKGVVGETVMRSARDMAVQHQDSAILAGATNNMENTKKAIIATIDDKKNALSALAATPGGPNKPEYQAALKDYDDALGKLGSNDLFKMPEESLDLQRKNFMGELKGIQLVSSVDATFDKKGKAQAQQELNQLFQNPDISREQANLLYRQGMSHLEYRSNDQIAGQKAAAQAIEYLRIGLAKGTISPSDPSIAGLRKQALDAGYADGVNQIDALSSVYTAHKAVQALPAADQPAALGVPSAGNDYYAITRRLESGGNDQAVSRNPSTGAPIAYGRYQFTAWTWRGLGEAHPELGLTGANILDPDKQEAAVRAFTNDNAEALQREGLQATPANLRMAAFLGSGGGPQFLKAMQANPNADASAMFPQAAQANPSIFYGKEGHPRSLADIYGLMTNKFGGAQMNGAPPSANGVPFTDDQAAANPWLRSEYFRSLAETKSVRAESFAGYETGSSAAIKAGNPLTDDTVKGLIQLSEGDPGKTAKAAELIGANIALKASMGGGGAPMTAPQIQQATQDAFKAAREAPDHLHQVLATSAYNYFKEQQKNAAEHPLQDGARRYNMAAPQPIDPQNPAGMADNIAYRGAMAQHYAQLNRSPMPSIFDKDELPVMKNILANPDPAVKAGVYGAIANLPEAVRGATLKALGGNDPKAMAEAAAGSLMKEAPDIAQSIFAGQGLMAQDKRYSPEGEGQQIATYKGDLDAALPPSTFTMADRQNPTGAYATTEEMVKARYAFLAAQAGKTDYSAARVTQAVNDVTGGVLSHNGGGLIAPVRGMTQEQFDATLRGVGDSDMAGAVTLGGQRVTPDYLRSSGTLESAGDGRYFVKLGRDLMKPVYAYSAAMFGGGKFILDLRSVKPNASLPVEAPAFFGNQ